MHATRCSPPEILAAQRSLTTRRSRERALGCSTRHAALFIRIHTASPLSCLSLSLPLSPRPFQCENGTRPNTELHSPASVIPRVETLNFLTKPSSGSGKRAASSLRAAK